jgi:hypothetical protein
MPPLLGGIDGGANAVGGPESTNDDVDVHAARTAIGAASETTSARSVSCTTRLP